MSVKNVQDVLRVTKKPLIKLPPSTLVQEAAEEMVQKKVGSVIITNGETLAGIFTERDLLTRVVGRELDPHTTKLSDVMTKNPDTVDADERVMKVLDTMLEKGYRHAPVLDGKKILGVVSLRDIYAAVRRELEKDIKLRNTLLFG